jgi:protein-S-isoprenylcysteine O-methyltransferase Ste14
MDCSPAGSRRILFPGWLRWVGFALGFAGQGFLAWTQATLGREWSPQLQLRGEHHLVTTGTYARVCHPLYTAMLVWEGALVTTNWVFLILAVVVIVGLMARVTREEQMMLEEFGEEYRAYMKRTGRFFPK